MIKKVITANDVADFFISLGNETGDSITNLRLQKLVFYAQAWHLANFTESLFNEDFEAWVHGPVIPELYRTYRPFSYKPISKELVATEVRSRFDDTKTTFLNEVADLYMTYTAYELEKMSHNENPWIVAREDLAPEEVCSTVINKESIKEYYSGRING